MPVVDRVERRIAGTDGPCLSTSSPRRGLAREDRVGLRHQGCGRLGGGRVGMKSASITPASVACRPRAVHATQSTTPSSEVGRHAVHARAVEQRQRAGDDARPRRRGSRAGLGAVEDRDHRDRADVVDDRRGGEEDAQLDRHAAPEHRDQRDREGGVGRHRHAPAVRPGPGRHERARRAAPAPTMPPSAAAIGSAASAGSRGGPTVNSRLISRPTTRKKIVSRPVVDPVAAAAGAAAAAAERDAPGLAPRTPRSRAPRRSWSARPRASVTSEQQQAGRGRPAREVERGRAHAVAERAQHRVGERAFVPGPVVAAAVDEEGRRERARRSRARSRSSASTARLARATLAAALRPPPAARARRPPRRDPSSVSVSRARHQRDVRLPELLVVCGALGELGRAPRDVAARQRPVPEDVAQPVAEAGRARSPMRSLAARQCGQA